MWWGLLFMLFCLVSSLNILQVHKTKLVKICIEEKNIFQQTFIFLGFQTTRLCVQQVYLTWARDPMKKTAISQRSTRALNLRPRCGDNDTGHQISRFDRCQLTMTWVSNTGIKSFSFLCGTQRIVGQKVSTKSWMAALSLSPLREHRYYLVLSSNIRVKGDKMKRENNPIRLPLETWCSLSVPQCAESNRGNWNSWCLYIKKRRHKPRVHVSVNPLAWVWPPCCASPSCVRAHEQYRWPW